MKVLIIANATEPYLSANGVCCNKIASEFIEQGHEVYNLAARISSNDKDMALIDGIHIRRIQLSLLEKLQVCVRKHAGTTKAKILYRILRCLLAVRLLLLLAWFPLKDPLKYNRFMVAAIKYHKEIGFDLIICPFNMLENCLVGRRLKQKHNIPLALYFLDCPSDNPKRPVLSKSFMDKKGYQWERKLYAAADLVLNLRCHKEHFDDPKYDEFRHKMRIVDIPSLMDRTEKKVIHSNKIAYTGTIYPMINHVLEVFALVGDVELHFHSGNGGVLPKHDFIRNHGFVKIEELYKIQQESGALLNMSHNNPRLIPSKIFEYMSTGNKIIHFGYGEEDACYPNLTKYRNALLLDVHGEPAENAALIRDFLDKPLEMIDFDQLKEQFPECLPEYTYKVIAEHFQF